MYFERLKRFFYDDYNNIFNDLNFKKSIMLRKIKIRI
jgi:hypothetical protein